MPLTREELHMLRPVYSARQQRATYPYPFGGYDELLDALIERAGVLGGKRVLDLDIQTGNLAARCVLAGAHVTGFSNEPPCEALTQRLPGVEVLNILPERRFDVAVAAYALTEASDEERVAYVTACFAQQLVPRGVLLLADASFEKAAARHAQLTAWSVPPHHALARDVLCQALIPAGFKVTCWHLSFCGAVYKIKRRE